MTDVVIKLHSASVSWLDGKTKILKVTKYEVNEDRGIKAHPLKMLHVLAEAFGIAFDMAVRMPTVFTDFGQVLEVIRITAYVECDVGQDDDFAQEYRHFFGREAFLADSATLIIGDSLTSDTGDLFAYSTHGIMGIVSKASVVWNADNPRRLDITFDFIPGIKLNIL